MKNIQKRIQSVMRGLQKNNQGVTLIELLVVFSLVAVVLSVWGISTALTPSTEAKRTIESIDSMIARLKVGALTKTGDVYMEINSDAKGIISVKYYEDDVLLVKEALTSGGVQVSYEVTSGTGGTLGRNQSIYLAFDRRTGGFTSMDEALRMATGTPVSGTRMCENIVVTGGPREFNIKLGAVTGSFTMNGE